MRDRRNLIVRIGEKGGRSTIASQNHEQLQILNVGKVQNDPLPLMLYTFNSTNP
jgi:hypothetical protein